MLDLQERLQKEIEVYNSLLHEEQELERQIQEKRDLRTQALGRVRLTQEMLAEKLEQESLEASANGDGDPERVMQSAYAKTAEDDATP